MIDIHSHVLPGLDDGSRSIEESVAMMRQAAASGTTDIVATPHSNLEFRYDADVVRGKIVELARATGPEPRLHCGCDFHLSYENVQEALANPTRYTINNHNYLLVEFSDLLIFKNTSEIFQMLLGACMTPIITHPERNLLLQQRLADLEQWVDAGCLLQVTGQSLLGRFGKRARKFGETLVERGLAHVIASDAHDTADRTTDLSAAWDHVKSAYGEECAERLFVSNPRHIVLGEPIGPTPPPQRRRKWHKPW